MSDESRNVWAQRLKAASLLVPAASRLAQLEKIAAALGMIRARLSPGGGTVGANEVRKLIGAHAGASPQRVFEFGEALYDAGVPWASGLLTLSWVPEYKPQTIGLIGRCIVDGDAEELRTMWDAFEIITMGVDGESFDRYLVRRFGVAFDPPEAAAPAGGEERYQRHFTWPRSAHTLLRAAWDAWDKSREDATPMLDVIQSYLAICRIPSGVPSPQHVAIEDFALNMVSERVFNLDPDPEVAWFYTPDKAAFWELKSRS